MADKKIAGMTAVLAADLTGDMAFPIYDPANPTSDIKTTLADVQTAFFGGGLTLTAATDIAAGTMVAVNGDGEAVQTWGPAPNVDGLVSLFGGAPISQPVYVSNIGSGGLAAAAIRLSDTAFVTFSSLGAQSCAVSGEAIAPGTLNTDVPSINVAYYGPQNANVWAAGLTSTTFVVIYIDPDTTNQNAVVGTVSGGVISYGTPVDLFSQSPSGITGNVLVVHSSTIFTVCTGLADDSFQAIACAVAVDVITPGLTAVTLAAAGALNGYSDVVGTGATSLIASFADQTNEQFLTSFVLSLTGTVVTAGDAQVSALSANNFYGRVVGSTFLVVEAGAGLAFLAGTISIDTIDFGDVLTIGGSSDPYSMWLDSFGSNFLAQGLSSPSGGSVSAPILISVTGTDISAGTLYPGTTNGVPAVLTSSVAMFTASNFSIYQIAADGSVSPGVDNQGVINYWLYRLSDTLAVATLIDLTQAANARIVTATAPNASPSAVYSPSDVAMGDTGTFYQSGLQGGASGLTGGQTVYANGDGTLTHANTGHPVGVAADATHLIVNVGG